MTPVQVLKGEIARGLLRGARLKEALAARAPSLRPPAAPGYDSLDALVDALLLLRGVPEETLQRHPEMVQYQPTPARVVMELIETAQFKPDDVFYDIGSGLGQVAILVSLIAGVRVRGVEFEPAYCDYARRCAAGLNAAAEFVNADARTVDYSGGTVFYLYTPFTGTMLADVLARLPRPLRLFTYGPCTDQVAAALGAQTVGPYALAMFRR